MPRRIVLLLSTLAAALLASGVALADHLVNTVYCPTDQDGNCEGTDESDHMYGTDAQDYIYAGFGDDQVDANAGDDYVDGGHGNDTLYGGEGGDRLDGAGGSPSLRNHRYRKSARATTSLRTIFSEVYCVALEFGVWCIHSKHQE